MASSPALDRPLPDSADLSACAREPIHAPGLIQPQGALFVVSVPELRVEHAAVGPGVMLRAEPSVGTPLADVLPAGCGPMLARVTAELPLRGTLNLGLVRGEAEGAVYHAIAHPSDQGLLFELETGAPDDPASFDEVYPDVQSFLGALQAAGSVAELGNLAAREVRRITGFDRALVYRFDAQWNGTVIAEDGNGRLPSLIDHRFPAEDIPAQARALYHRNRLRLIPDVAYTPVPIRPEGPVDLSPAVLRSVSPVHLEYMRNMGTAASMSISLLQGDELWGLISCHNVAPHRVPYPVRTACDFLGQILALQLAAREQGALADRRIELRVVQGRLLGRMASEESFARTLAGEQRDLLGLVHAAGAAIVTGGETLLVGETPGEEAVAAIVAWLSTREPEDVFATDALSTLLPEAQAWKDQASGLLAVPISQIHDSYVLWFRPEVVRTIRWGGNPAKPQSAPEGTRLHPRKSFETWAETVRQRSVPWDAAEIDAALQLRNAIVDIVLRQAEEMAELNEQLVRSNRELEAFSYSVSHDLRAPFRHIVGYSQLLMQKEATHLTDRGKRYIATIIESALSAGTLVDDLLSFSQMGRATLHKVDIDMNALVAEVRRRFGQDMTDRKIDWDVQDVPPGYGDPTMIRLVLQNLIDNAIKFTRHTEQARITVAAERKNGETVYRVADNGVGFDMAYVGKLFGVFQRLHRVEEFEGTGIGLANVKRIIEHRHGGRVWAEGAPGQGATLFFTLPPREP